MKWKPSHSVIENARNFLPKLVEKYFKAGRKAADGKRSPDELHQSRIKTKRFRYTLELFLPAYGTRLDQELEPIRELQKVVGKLHDYHIIEQMLEGEKTLQANLWPRLIRAYGAILTDPRTGRWTNSARQRTGR